MIIITLILMMITLRYEAPPLSFAMLIIDAARRAVATRSRRYYWWYIIIITAIISLRHFAARCFRFDYVMLFLLRDADIDYWLFHMMPFWWHFRHFRWCRHMLITPALRAVDIRRGDSAADYCYAPLSIWEIITLLLRALQRRYYFRRDAWARAAARRRQRAIGAICLHTPARYDASAIAMLLIFSAAAYIFADFRLLFFAADDIIITLRLRH